MPSVKRLYQACFNTQKQDMLVSSAATLFTSANSDLLVIDPSMTIEKENFERSNINRGSLSPLKPLAGITTVAVEFGLEMTAGAGTDDPSWSGVIEACGMRRSLMGAYRILAITPGAGLQAINAGERLVQTTSGATATLVHTIRKGSSPDLHAFLAVDQGGLVANAIDLWTSSDSGGSFTVEGGNAGTVGTCWLPASFPTHTSGLAVEPITDILVGTVVTGVTSLAVGILTRELGPTLGNSVVELRRLDGEFDDAEVVTFSDGAANGTLNVAWSQLANPAINFGFIEDGRRKRGSGFRGSWAFVGETGSPGILNFSMKGIYQGVDDGGAIPGVSYSALVPAVLLGTTINVGKGTDTFETGDTPRVSTVNFDLAADVQLPRDMTETTGVYDAAFTTGRSSSGTINLSILPEGTYPWLGAMVDGDPVSILLSVPTPGNANKVFRIEACGAQVTAESVSDQNGFAVADYTLSLASVAADDTDTSEGELIISYQHTALPVA